MADPQINEGQNALVENQNVPAVEEQNNEDAPAVENQNEQEPVVENQNVEEPAVENQNEDVPVDENQNNEEIPAVEEQNNEDAPVVENQNDEDIPQNEEIPAVENQNNEDAPAVENQNEDAPAVENQHVEEPAVENQNEDAPAVEEVNNEDAPVVENQNEDAPAVEEQNNEEIPQNVDVPAVEEQNNEEIPQNEDAPAVENQNEEEPLDEHQHNEEIHQKEEIPAVDNQNVDVPAVEEQNNEDALAVENQNNDDFFIDAGNIPFMDTSDNEEDSLDEDNSFEEEPVKLVGPISEKELELKKNIFQKIDNNLSNIGNVKDPITLEVIFEDNKLVLEKDKLFPIIRNHKMYLYTTESLNVFMEQPEFKEVFTSTKFSEEEINDMKLYCLEAQRESQEDFDKLSPEEKLKIMEEELKEMNEQKKVSRKLKALKKLDLIGTYFPLRDYEGIPKNSFKIIYRELRNLWINFVYDSRFDIFKNYGKEIGWYVPLDCDYEQQVLEKIDVLLNDNLDDGVKHMVSYVIIGAFVYCCPTIKQHYRDFEFIE